MEALDTPNVQARYHEKIPNTKADIANSRARRKVAAARVPSASLDMLSGENRDCKRKMGGEWDWDWDWS